LVKGVDATAKQALNQKNSRCEKSKTTQTKTMKIQIDLKSAVCGLIIGVAAMFALGADSSSSNQIGRYQVSSGAEDAAVIVDTITGKAWAFQPQNTSQWRTDGNFWDAKGGK
jgi:hypothetical protein